ncbi:HTH lysR-type domain-containing protein [Nocardia ninae]|uniref:HTH lysR-type domain-containing protein n=1 Tax=Nocardia ninae NBRC 108245 TaxID=1210091 RepID=A0A511M7T3_9NOCA|nr:hypothetical protein NN4_11780 [Nocardia ninae NBRC 108245]
MTLPPGTPDLEVLDLLVSVAELGSLGAAARRHGISQPAAGMRISTLERRLRLRLLDRGHTGSALTDAGHTLIELSRPVLAAAATLADGIAALHHTARPSLHIAASKTIADHRIPHWLSALRKIRPELAVALEVANSQQVTAAVRERDTELGFVEGPHSPPGLGSRVLVADDLVVVVAPTHPWATRRRAVTLRELADTPLLWREKGSGTRDTVWQASRCMAHRRHRQPNSARPQRFSPLRAAPPHPRWSAASSSPTSYAPARSTKYLWTTRSS